MIQPKTHCHTVLLNKSWLSIRTYPYPWHTVANFNNRLVFPQVPHDTSASVSGRKDMLNLSVPRQTGNIVWWLHEILETIHQWRLITTWLKFASRLKSWTCPWYPTPHLDPANTLAGSKTRTAWHLQQQLSTAAVTVHLPPHVNLLTITIPAALPVKLTTDRFDLRCSHKHRGGSRISHKKGPQPRGGCQNTNVPDFPKNARN